MTRHLLLTCSCSSTPNFAKHFVANKFHLDLKDIELFIGIQRYKNAIATFPPKSEVAVLLQAKMQRNRKYAYYLEIDENNNILNTLDVMKGVKIEL